MFRKIRFLAALAFGLAIATASHADQLDQMISPLSNPINFEDPRNISEIRPVYLYHEIDEDFVTGGGDVRIYALQLRYALSDKFAFIATKDGYVDANFDGVLNDESGWGNVTPGVKYAFHKDDNSIFSGQLRYELPLGNRDVFQGTGDGFIQPSMSAAYAAGPVNIMAGTGLRLAVDDSDSSYWDADLHFDIPIGSFYPVLEFSMFQSIDDGDRLPIGDEGQDYFNFGSTDASGRTLVTAGTGARYRVMENLDLGIVYQFPLTDGKGSQLIDWRITTDLIYRFDC